ncbi:MAG: glycosyltransferase family 39 protein [Candidatus Rokubacteria bacterium]|nr:glycosyltransferase family 39 protein [Candidatus Rokubacteria bacterium]
MGDRPNVTMSRERMLVLVVLALALTVGVGCIVASWDKPIVGDLIVYSWWARGALETGVTGAVFNPDEGLYPGNLHAPTYSYLLAAGFGLFGDRPRSAILVNLACFGATLALLRALARRLSPAPEIAVWMTWTLVLVHPFSLQSVLLTDTDTTLVPVAILGYSLVLLRNLDRMSPRRVMLLGLVFSACLWSKFTTPLILPAMTMLFFLLRGQIVGGIRDTAIITATGAAGYVVTDYIFSRVTGLAPFAAVGVASGKFQDQLGTQLAAKLGNMMATLKTDFVWLGLPFVILVALALVERAQRYARERSVHDADFIAVLAVSTYVVYTVAVPTGGIPRYKSVTFPLFALLVGDLLARLLARATVSWRAVATAVAVTALTAWYYAGLPEIVLTATELSAREPSASPKLALVAAFALPVVGLAAVAAVVWRRLDRRAIAWACVVVLAPLAVVTDVKQARAEGPSNFFGIGQTGFRDTVVYLKTHARRDEMFFSYKDVPYYTRNQYYLYFRYAGSRRAVDLDRLAPILERRNVGWWIIEDSPVRFGDVTFDAPARAFLDRNFVPAAAFGEFRIYRRRVVAR